MDWGRDHPEWPRTAHGDAGVPQEQPTLTRLTSLTHFRVGEWQHAPVWLRSLELAASYTLLRPLPAAISPQAADSVLAGCGRICSFIIFFISFTVGSAL
jgi:hypothetical protein